MSNISELREQVAELHTRLEIVEKLLLDTIKRANVQDLSTEMVRVEEEEDLEMRTLIGFKQNKKPTR